MIFKYFPSLSITFPSLSLSLSPLSLYPFPLSIPFLTLSLSLLSLYPFPLSISEKWVQCILFFPIISLHSLIVSLSLCSFIIQFAGLLFYKHYLFSLLIHILWTFSSLFTLAWVTLFRNKKRRMISDQVV